MGALVAITLIVNARCDLLLFFDITVNSFLLLSTMASRKISKISKKTMAKKSSKIIRKKSSKKTKEGKKKRTAPAALIKVMNVSNELADIIGTKKASRPQAIKGLWAYIKKNNLQDPSQRQYFTPDAKMAKVFGKNKMKAIHMSKYLSANLSD